VGFQTYEFSFENHINQTRKHATEYDALTLVASKIIPVIFKYFKDKFI
jgi:hypothetical protein